MSNNAIQCLNRLVIIGKMIRSEDDLHLLIGNYLNIKEPNLKKKGLIYWTYSPAGELRNKSVAIKLKRKGVKKGDADYRLEFIKNNIQYNGYFEIKFGKNKLTKEQKAIFKSRSKVKNTKCYTCYSFEEFEESLNNFLGFIEVCQLKEKEK